MKRSDFHFELPPELIAQQPLPGRSDARLLALADGGPRDLRVTDLPGLIRPGELLVFNDTRVIPARLHARKDSGGAVEIMVERVLDSGQALAFLRASKTPREGGELHLGDARITVQSREGQLFRLQLARGDWWQLLEAHGEVPLPPYIRRSADQADRERYQTVFAREPGAVAAPTAGLHFDEALLAAVDARGARRDYLTLHVGAGTFMPMRSENLSEHQMHAERLVVSQALVDRIAETRQAGGRVVAVGTTVVRALETAAAQGELQAYAGESRLFITPGFEFRVVDALLTNFHLPESTLLMLVCAFAGYDPVLAAYRHAVAQGYRFFSYGDAMWLERAR